MIFWKIPLLWAHQSWLLASFWRKNTFYHRSLHIFSPLPHFFTEEITGCDCLFRPSPCTLRSLKHFAHPVISSVEKCGDNRVWLFIQTEPLHPQVIEAFCTPCYLLGGKMRQRWKKCVRNGDKTCFFVKTKRGVNFDALKVGVFFKISQTVPTHSMQKSIIYHHVQYEMYTWRNEGQKTWQRQASPTRKIPKVTFLAEKLLLNERDCFELW